MEAIDGGRTLMRPDVPIEPIYRTVGGNVRRERERRGLTRADLAQRLGVTREHVGRIEAGKQRLMLHHMVNLLGLFLLSAEELLISQSEEASQKLCRRQDAHSEELWRMHERRSSQPDSWAMVELMDHKVFAGKVSEQLIGGSAFIRVDVPELPARERAATEPKDEAELEVCPTTSAFTKLIAGGSIFAITLCSEELARKVGQEKGASAVDMFGLGVPSQAFAASTGSVGSAAASSGGS